MAVARLTAVHPERRRRTWYHNHEEVPLPKKETGIFARRMRAGRCVTQVPILSDQIFILEQESLIDQPGDVRKLTAEPICCVP
jgi:hypothetical protein